jgi:hypothetical protein
MFGKGSNRPRHFVEYRLEYKVFSPFSHLEGGFGKASSITEGAGSHSGQKRIKQINHCNHKHPPLDTQL